MLYHVNQTLKASSLLVCIVICLAFTRVSADAIRATGSSSDLNECGNPVQLQWENSIGETDVTIIDEGGKIIRSFFRQPAGTDSITWYPINATAGQKIYLVVRDAAGQVAVSQPMTVGSGSTSDICQPVNDAALPSFTLFSGAPVPTMSTTTRSITSTQSSTSLASTTNTSFSGTTQSSSMHNNSTSSAPTAGPSGTMPMGDNGSLSSFTLSGTWWAAALCVAALICVPHNIVL